MGQKERMELALDDRSSTDSGGMFFGATQGDFGSGSSETRTLELDQEALRRTLLQDVEGDSEDPGRELKKNCTKCDKIFPLDSFYRAVNGKYGRSARCIECVRAYKESRKFEHSNYMSSYRDKNRERMNAQERDWYLRNKKRHADGRRKWYLKNREFVIEQQRAYYLANHERYRNIRKAWEAANKNLVKIIRLRRVNAKFIRAVHQITEKMLLDRLEYFGNSCAYCGGPHEHWDHVKPLSKGGLHMLGNLRPSCRSCNLRKGSKLPEHWFRLIRNISPSQAVTSN